MYSAIVSKIKTAEHPDADRLQIGYCHGFTVVIGKDIQDGTVGVFFPCDGQLSDEFCKKNNLYPEYDAEGNRTGGGFIDPKNRRVRAQNFRGVKSSGFWVPLSYFSYLNVSLDEGQTFTELKGRPICNKYVNPATLKAIANAKKGATQKATYRETPMFPMHGDTPKLRFFLNSIPLGSTIYVTEKLHGTSARTANAPSPRKFDTVWSRVQKAYDTLRGREKSPYQILTGSRRVIKEFAQDKQGFYGSDEFRYDASEVLGHFLRKGEAVYYELVGYAGDSPIMPPVSNSAVGKEFVKQFGKTTEWTYGCVPGTYRIYIYNWMLSSPDGFHYSYPWPFIEKRCKEFGLEPVPLLAQYTLADYDSYQVQISELSRMKFVNISRETLAKEVDKLTQDQYSVIAPHLREGVCLRAEKDGELVGIYKNKATSFGILEGYLKSEENYVDTEELESGQ